MPDERVEALLSIGLDETKARQAVQSLDAMKKGMADVEKETQKARESLRRLAEQGMKLREIGAVTAAVGAGMLAPLIASAAEYQRRYAGLEATSNAFAKAQQRSADASAAFGRVSAQVLIPVMNQVADIQTKIAQFAAQHPELVQAAATGGAALVAGGGALIMAGTAISTIARSAELLKGALGGGKLGGLAGGLAQAAVGAAAFTGGLKIGEGLVNAYGKAVGDSRLEHFKLTDALKTLREAIGTVVMIATAVYEQARIAAERAVDSLAGIWILAKNAVEKFTDDLGLGVAKFLKNILDEVDKFGAQLGLAIYMITHPGDASGATKYASDQAQQVAGRIGQRQGAINDIEARNKQNQANRDLQAQLAGDILSGKDKDRNDKAVATIKQRAKETANFVETGALGPVFDGIVGKVKDFVKQAQGFFSGGGGSALSTGGAAGVSPEAVRAFIERNKALANSDRQFAIDKQNLQREYNLGEAKAKRDQAVELGKLDLENSRNERDARAKFNLDQQKAQQDFLLSERQIEEKQRLDALIRLKEHNFRLTDLAAARDVAGFVQEMRQFAMQEDATRKQEALEKKQRDDKFAADNKDREKQYEFDRAQEKIHAEDRRADMLAQFRREDQERQTAYQEQLRALDNKHRQEKDAIDRAFAEQLAALTDNLAGLNDMQNRYYQQQGAALAAFVDQNKAKLQELYNSTISGASGGSTAPATSSYTPAQVQTGYGVSVPTSVASGGSSAIDSFISRRYLEGSFASGLDRAPKDMFVKIHQGEGVVTAAANLNGGGGGATFDFSGATFTIGAGNNVTVSDLKSALRDLAHALPVGGAAGGTA